MSDNQYAAITTTFITTPIINKLWNDLSNDAAGSGTGVTLGSDDWFPRFTDLVALRQAFHDRRGGSGQNLSQYLNKNDQAFMGTLTLWNNFADGLVDVSDKTVVNPFPDDPTSVSQIANDLTLRLAGFYVDQNDVVQNNGTFDVPFHGWNVPHEVNFFSPLSMSDLRTLGQDNVKATGISIQMQFVGDPAFSTVTIDTGFQGKRCLVWASLDVRHTFSSDDQV